MNFVKLFDVLFIVINMHTMISADRSTLFGNFLYWAAAVAIFLLTVAVFL